MALALPRAPSHAGSAPHRLRLHRHPLRVDGRHTHAGGDEGVAGPDVVCVHSFRVASGLGEQDESIHSSNRRAPTMRKQAKYLAAGGAIAVVLGGAGMATATGGADDDGSDTPISGTALEQASEAALAHTGEGKVTETEVGDEESYYEVEVTLDDGSEVDVQLDEGFNVVGSESDSGSESDGSGDD